MANKSWRDLTVNQFIEINTFDKKNEMDFIINRLAVILDKPNDEIENLDYQDYIKIEKELEWSVQPPKSQPQSKLSIQGIDFHLIPDFNQMTLGEFIDLEYYFQDGYIKNLTTILAILYRPLIREETILGPTIIEEYNVDPKYRAHIFEEISIDLVYGIIPKYLKWRTKLLADYHGLFNQNSDDDQDEIEDIKSNNKLSGVEKAEMLKAIDEERKQKKWSWTLFLYILADYDALKIEQASKLPILAAMNIYAMRQELQLKQ